MGAATSGNRRSQNSIEPVTSQPIGQLCCRYGRYGTQRGRQHKPLHLVILSIRHLVSLSHCAIRIQQTLARLHNHKCTTVRRSADTYLGVMTHTAWDASAGCLGVLEADDMLEQFHSCIRGLPALCRPMARVHSSTALSGNFFG